MEIIRLIIKIAMLLYIGFVVLCLGIATYINLKKKTNEDDIKAKGFIEGYKQIKNNAIFIKSIDKDFFFELVDYLLSEREQDKARIKELESKLEEANKQLDLDYVDENYIPKQKAKEMQAKIKELEEENRRKDMFMQMAKEVIENSILKKRVKKSIAEAKRNRKYANTAYEYTEEDVWDIVKDNLEELLQEGE